MTWRDKKWRTGFGNRGIPRVLSNRARRRLMMSRITYNYARDPSFSKDLKVSKSEIPSRILDSSGSQRKRRAKEFKTRKDSHANPYLEHPHLNIPISDHDYKRYTQTLMVTHRQTVIKTTTRLATLHPLTIEYTHSQQHRLPSSIKLALKSRMLPRIY